MWVINAEPVAPPCVMASLTVRARAQVLFCTLTADQRDLYCSYLASSEVADILAVRLWPCTLITRLP